MKTPLEAATNKGLMVDLRVPIYQGSNKPEYKG